ncbi:MAG: helix-turn-helix domain-containing protein [Phycisphaerae bacterium]|nr:helix-turn-helix domain-containing protein [Phycisphaerae bacterium]
MRRNPFPGIPELAEIGFDRFHSAQGLERHSHPGLFALCYITGGSVRFIAGQQECELHGGDAFCAWPGEELRGVDDMIQPCTLYWLLLRMSKQPPRRFIGLTHAEGMLLHNRLWHLPRRAFATSDETHELVARLIQLDAAPDTLDAVAARATLIQLLIIICQFADQPNTGSAYSPPIAAAIELMGMHVAEPLSMSDLARRVGLSISHFQRLFKAQTGLAPGDYYIRRRIGVARRLLTSTKLPLVEIALRCGFGSSQYFATSFRRVIGQRPSAYRNAAQEQ